MSIVQRVHDTTDGFAGLSETEKQSFAVSVLDGEIYNGGFDQFFFHHDPDGLRLRCEAFAQRYKLI
jgi:hypothetical protein